MSWNSIVGNKKTLRNDKNYPDSTLVKVAENVFNPPENKKLFLPKSSL
jgi:hypothetical protein